MHEVVAPPPLQAPAAAVGGRVADGDDAHHLDVGGDRQQLPDVARSVGPQEAGRQPLVDCRQQQVLHGGTGVDPPVGNGPVDLRPVGTGLVGLPVALVVALGADGHHDVHRGPADPRVVAGGDVARLIGGGGDGAPQLGVGDDDEGVALAEAGGRGAPAGIHDASDGVLAHGVSGVVAHHAPPADDVGELHHTSDSDSWMPSSAALASEKNIRVPSA